jgi:probable addiction module antidote protein
MFERGRFRRIRDADRLRTGISSAFQSKREASDPVARGHRQTLAEEGYHQGDRTGGAEVTVAKLKTRRYDTANYLKTAKDIAEYLEAVFEIGDPALVAHALGVVARAKGMAEVSRKTGLGRESLYKALSKDGNPKIDTVLKVVHALGIKMKFAA